MFSRVSSDALSSDDDDESMGRLRTTMEPAAAGCVCVPQGDSQATGHMRTHCTGSALPILQPRSRVQPMKSPAPVDPRPWETHDGRARVASCAIVAQH